MGLAGLRPTRFGRNPEDVLSAVFVRVLGVRTARLLRHELRVLLLEGVRDVLEKDQAQDDMLVLRRIHAPAKRIGGRPELCLEAKGRAVG